MLKPSVWGDADTQAQLHTARLSLGLHVPKRYIIIAQQADNDGSEVYLRFSISLSDLSYTVSTTNDAARLVIEVQTHVRHQIIYSEVSNSADEREIDRCMVHLNCTISVRDFEKGTKLVLQAKDKSDEQGFRHIILGMVGLIQGEHKIHHIRNTSPPEDTWGSPGIATTAAANPNAISMPILLDSVESPEAMPADLLGDVNPDIWQGLEQLDIGLNKESSELQPPTNASQARAESNEFGKEAHAKLAGIIQPFVALEENTSEPISLPITTTEDALDSNTPFSGAFYLPPTRDVSTIQTLPCAVAPPRHIPTISAIEPYTPSGGLQGTLEEQRLQEEWQITNAQWSSTRKRSKYVDVKTTYISGPRQSDDVRMHELRVDSSGELKGVLSSTTNEGRNKENRGTTNPGQLQSTGSGKGAFRNLSGRRAWRGDGIMDRGRTAERGSDGVGECRGRGYGRYTTRGRAGRQGRGGRGMTGYQAGGRGSGW